MNRKTKQFLKRKRADDYLDKKSKWDNWIY